MKEQDDVLQFHERFGFRIGEDVRVRPPEINDRSDAMIASITQRLAWLSQDLRSICRHPSLEASDSRIERLQLMVEELSEVARALHHRDPIELADGLADLQYVVLGTAVTYGMPMEDLHDEVHESNMSKDVGTDHKPIKGSSFHRPDIEGVLKRHGRI